MENNLIDLYTDYLISRFDQATATGLSKVFDGEISHDKITRFLSSKQFTGFVSAIKSNRLIALTEEQKKQGHFVAVDSLELSVKTKVGKGV